MIFVIIIVVIIVGLFMLGVFDSEHDEQENTGKMDTPNPWKYNKTTAQLYFDVYVSAPMSGRHYILKISENNFAALDVLDYEPYSSSKNELLLELDNRANHYPEQNLSQRLGICRIKGKEVKIYFADKDMYHSGINELPFDYMSFEGGLVNKTLIFDINEKYYDQSTKSTKVRTLRKKVPFNQL